MTVDSQKDIEHLKAISRIVEERDGWLLRTSGRTIAAQFEHTIVVTKNESIILTV